MLKSVVKQYLDRYAESETHQLKGFHSRPFKNCIVIPCFNETPHFFQRLCKSALAEETLVIVVINQPAATSVSSQNIQLAEFLQQSRLLWRRDNLSLLESQHCGAWLLVDRFTQNQIPPKQGVGLARKIGCDLAVKLKQQGFIASNWIHCTDADAHLPDNYFDIPGQGSAAVFNFTHFQAPHTYDPAVEEATQCYERAIKYYVAGLRWAGSPYAFNTVGSALAVEHQAYCQVRGFPKKAGGEDFYLLNKLAKLGPVIEAKHITVRLEPRLSQRTPFGTGQSVAQILTDKDRPAPTLVYYHPQTFTHLKAWLNQAFK